MVVQREWVRTTGQFLANGATPLSFNQGNTFNIPGVAGKPLTILSVVTDLELYIACGAAGMALIDSKVWQETVMVFGTELYPSTAGELISSTPLTNTNSNPASLRDWAQWNRLYHEDIYIDLNAPAVATITYRPKEGTVRTDSRRSVAAGVGVDVWLAWEIQDGSGLINTTTAGVTYSLGARFNQQVLFEYKS